MRKHDRAAAFTGSDGAAYSVGIWLDEEPDAAGRYGAALLFVRWSAGGDRPMGHLESDYLAWGASPEEAEARLKALSLYDVKETLDRLIAAAGGPPGESDR